MFPSTDTERSSLSVNCRQIMPPNLVLSKSNFAWYAKIAAALIGGALVDSEVRANWMQETGSSTYTQFYDDGGIGSIQKSTFELNTLGTNYSLRLSIRDDVQWFKIVAASDGADAYSSMAQVPVVTSNANTGQNGGKYEAIGSFENGLFPHHLEDDSEAEILILAYLLTNAPNSVTHGEYLTETAIPGVIREFAANFAPSKLHAKLRRSAKGEINGVDFWGVLYATKLTDPVPVENTHRSCLMGSLAIAAQSQGIPVSMTLTTYRPRSQDFNEFLEKLDLPPSEVRKFQGNIEKLKQYYSAHFVWVPQRKSVYTYSGLARSVASLWPRPSAAYDDSVARVRVVDYNVPNAPYSYDLIPPATPRFTYSDPVAKSEYLRHQRQVLEFKARTTALRITAFVVFILFASISLIIFIRSKAA